MFETAFEYDKLRFVEVNIKDDEGSAARGAEAAHLHVLWMAARRLTLLPERFLPSADDCYAGLIAASVFFLVAFFSRALLSGKKRDLDHLTV